MKTPAYFFLLCEFNLEHHHSFKIRWKAKSSGVRISSICFAMAALQGKKTLVLKDSWGCLAQFSDLDLHVDTKKIWSLYPNLFLLSANYTFTLSNYFWYYLRDISRTLVWQSGLAFFAKGYRMYSLKAVKINKNYTNSLSWQLHSPTPLPGANLFWDKGLIQHLLP